MSSFLFIISLLSHILSESQVHATYTCLWWFIEIKPSINARDALNIIMLYEIREYFDVLFNNNTYQIDLEWNLYNTNNTNIYNSSYYYLVHVNVNIISQDHKNDLLIDFMDLSNDIVSDWMEFYYPNDILISNTIQSGVLYNQNNSYILCGLPPIYITIQTTSETSTTKTIIITENTENDINAHENDNLSKNILIIKNMYIPAICGCISFILLAFIIYALKIRNKMRLKSHINTGSRIQIIELGESKQLNVEESKSKSENENQKSSYDSIDSDAINEYKLPKTPHQIGLEQVFEEKEEIFMNISEKKYRNKKKKYKHRISSSDSEVLYEYGEMMAVNQYKSDSNTMRNGEHDSLNGLLEDEYEYKFNFKMPTNSNTIIDSDDYKLQDVFIEEIKRWFEDTLFKLLDFRYEYFKLFVINGFDNMSVIKEMTENDLILIGINKLGHRKQIMLQIELL